MQFQLKRRFTGDRRVHLLREGKIYTIGRGLDSDIVCTSNLVSRHHAELKVENNRLWVKDLKSMNGVSINGRPSVEPNVWIPVTPGNALWIGLKRVSTIDESDGKYFIFEVSVYDSQEVDVKPVVGLPPLRDGATNSFAKGNDIQPPTVVVPVSILQSANCQIGTVDPVILTTAPPLRPLIVASASDDITAIPVAPGVVSAPPLVVSSVPGSAYNEGSCTASASNVVTSPPFAAHAIPGVSYSHRLTENNGVVFNSPPHEPPRVMLVPTLSASHDRYSVFSPENVTANTPLAESTRLSEESSGEAPPLVSLGLISLPVSTICPEEKPTASRMLSKPTTVHSPLSVRTDLVAVKVPVRPSNALDLEEVAYIPPLSTLPVPIAEQRNEQTDNIVGTPLSHEVENLNMSRINSAGIVQGKFGDDPAPITTSSAPSINTRLSYSESAELDTSVEEIPGPLAFSKRLPPKDPFVPTGVNTNSSDSNPIVRIESNERIPIIAPSPLTKTLPSRDKSSDLNPSAKAIFEHQLSTRTSPVKSSVTKADIQGRSRESPEKNIVERVVKSSNRCNTDSSKNLPTGFGRTDSETSLQAEALPRPPKLSLFRRKKPEAGLAEVSKKVLVEVSKKVLKRSVSDSSPELILSDEGESESVPVSSQSKTLKISRRNSEGDNVPTDTSSLSSKLSRKRSKSGETPTQPQVETPLLESSPQQSAVQEAPLLLDSRLSSRKTERDATSASLASHSKAPHKQSETLHIKPTTEQPMKNFPPRKNSAEYLRKGSDASPSIDDKRKKSISNVAATNKPTISFVKAPTETLSEDPATAIRSDKLKKNSEPRSLNADLVETVREVEGTKKAKTSNKPSISKNTVDENVSVDSDEEVIFSKSSKHSSRLDYSSDDSSPLKPQLASETHSSVAVKPRKLKPSFMRSKSVGTERISSPSECTVSKNTGRTQLKSIRNLSDTKADASSSRSRGEQGTSESSDEESNVPKSFKHPNRWDDSNDENCDRTKPKNTIFARSKSVDSMMGPKSVDRKGIDRKKPPAKDELGEPSRSNDRRSSESSTGSDHADIMSLMTDDDKKKYKTLMKNGLVAAALRFAEEALFKRNPKKQPSSPKKKLSEADLLRKHGIRKSEVKLNRLTLRELKKWTSKKRIAKKEDAGKVESGELHENKEKDVNKEDSYARSEVLKETAVKRRMPEEVQGLLSKVKGAIQRSREQKNVALQEDSSEPMIIVAKEKPAYQAAKEKPVRQPSLDDSIQEMENDEAVSEFSKESHSTKARFSKVSDKSIMSHKLEAIKKEEKQDKPKAVVNPIQSVLSQSFSQMDDIIFLSDSESEDGSHAEGDPLDELLIEVGDEIDQLIRIKEEDVETDADVSQWIEEIAQSQDIKVDSPKPIEDGKKESVGEIFPFPVIDNENDVVPEEAPPSSSDEEEADNDDNGQWFPDLSQRFLDEIEEEEKAEREARDAENDEQPEDHVQAVDQPGPSVNKRTSRIQVVDAPNMPLRGRGKHRGFSALQAAQATSEAQSPATKRARMISKPPPMPTPVRRANAPKPGSLKAAMKKHLPAGYVSTVNATVRAATAVKPPAVRDRFKQQGDERQMAPEPTKLARPPAPNVKITKTNRSAFLAEPLPLKPAVKKRPALPPGNLPEVKRRRDEERKIGGLPEQPIVDQAAPIAGNLENNEDAEKSAAPENVSRKRPRKSVNFAEQLEQIKTIPARSSRPLNNLNPNVMRQADNVGQDIFPRSATYFADRVPRQLSHAMSLEGARLQMLRWTPNWIKEVDKEENKDVVPPGLICPVAFPCGLTPIRSTFTGLRDYLSQFGPPMFVEMFANLKRSFEENKKAKKFGHFFAFENGEDGLIKDESEFWILNLQTVKRREHATFFAGLRDGSLVKLEVPVCHYNEGKGQNEILHLKFFGYITFVQYRKLKDITEKVHSEIKKEYRLRAEEMRSPNIEFVKILIQIYRKRVMGPDPIVYDRKVQLTLMCSNVKSWMRQFPLLHKLGQSPLKDHILRPTPDLIHLDPIAGNRLALDSRFADFNYEQQKAIRTILGNCLATPEKAHLYLLQGPPGTGKTKTLAAMIVQLLLCKPSCSIMVCAPSNGAVDEIVYRVRLELQRLKEVNRFRVIRIGVQESVSQEVRQVELDTMVRKAVKDKVIKNNQYLAGLQTEYTSLKKEAEQRKVLKDRHPDDMVKLNLYAQADAKFIDLQKKLSDETDKAVNEYLMKNRDDVKIYKRNFVKTASIIATTLSSSSQENLEQIIAVERKKFDFCFVDEASQCTETEVLQPLAYGMQNLILVGDHKQLQATVVTKSAASVGYGRSLFARLANLLEDENGIPCLRTQYRMHPAISKFPSEYFYRGLLMNGQGTDKLVGIKPYIWLDVTDSKEETDGGDIQNRREAVLVARIANLIVSLIQLPSVGVISPYNWHRKAVQEELCRSMNRRSSEVQVGTIDGFRDERNMQLFCQLSAPEVIQSVSCPNLSV